MSNLGEPPVVVEAATAPGVGDLGESAGGGGDRFVGRPAVGGRCGAA